MGEKSNMRQVLLRIQREFGGKVEQGFSYGWVNPPPHDPALSIPNRAILDLARILDKVLE